MSCSGCGKAESEWEKQRRRQGHRRTVVSRWTMYKEKALKPNRQKLRDGKEQKGGMVEIVVGMVMGVMVGMKRVTRVVATEIERKGFLKSYKKR
jgi:hypothetical protein